MPEPGPRGDAPERRRWAAAALAVLVVLGTATVAPAASYDDVDVTVENEPTGTGSHGYAEIWVRVANRSAQTPHEVRLTLPKSSYSMGSDYLRAVSRTVTVEPGKVVRVALTVPERIPILGNGLGVAVDGTSQDEIISVRFGRPGAGSRASGYGYSGTAPQPLILFSRTVDTRFPDWVTPGRGPATSGAGPECVRAEQPVGNWSPNWLGYTRYDGVVVTADDLRVMPADVRAAIGQYVECGGSLLVLGPNALLPGRWHPERLGQIALSGCVAGFGQCFVTDRTDLSDWEPMSVVLGSWSQTLRPWQRARSPGEANRVFPVVDDIGVPVNGLLALMFIFAVVIGPINLLVLARRGRRLWLFWTVPLVSLITCLAVFAYMALNEGWEGRARVEGFTILDENTRRASTLGWAAFYTPLLPGGGLHFSSETEVSFQNGEDPGAGYGYRRRGGGTALAVDWTREQHLTSGWLTPRIPAHFVVRKGELRRERVTITKGADGRPEAVNGLGADLTDLWYADEGGNLFHTGSVPAGARVALDPAPRPTPPAGGKSLRDAYLGEWATVVDRMKTDGPALLPQRSYLAVMEAAPFLDDGLTKRAVRKARSVVLGILKEGGDEG